MTDGFDTLAASLRMTDRKRLLSHLVCVIRSIVNAESGRS